MARAKAVALDTEISAKLAEWQQLEQQLADVKTKEFALRQELVLKCGFDPSKLEGAESLEIGNGWKLKATKKQNYSLTNANRETEQLLAAIAAKDRVDLSNGLVKWSPDMSTKVYKEVVEAFGSDPTIKPLLAAALTIKPGAPSLELVPPEPPKTS